MLRTRLNRSSIVSTATLTLALIAAGCAPESFDEPMPLSAKGDGDGARLVEKNLLWFDAESGPTIVAEALLRGLPGRCTLADLVPRAPQMWTARVPSTSNGGVVKQWIGIEINDFRARISPDGQLETMEAIDFLATDFVGCEGEQLKTCRYHQPTLLSEWEAKIVIDSATETISALEVYFRTRGVDSYRYHITCP